MEGIPYADYRMYNAAKVAYMLACNRVRAEYAGADSYERKRKLFSVRFDPPYVMHGGKKYCLVGVKRGEEVLLLYFFNGGGPNLAAAAYRDGKFVRYAPLEEFFSGEYDSVAKLDKSGRPRLFALDKLING